MTNLPVPTPSTAAAGNFLTSALWNAQVRDAINFLTNPPIFFGYQSVAQSLPATTYTAIGMDTETLDSYGGHSTTTNTSRYVCQLAGTYEVCAVAAVQPNSGGFASAYVAKNGSEIIGSRIAYAAMSGHNSAAPTAVTQVQLAVGDYVELYVYSGVAVSTAVGPWSSLTVKFIHS
jgi:hypothetical protein